MPPEPRRASGPRNLVLALGALGSMRPVGWSCTLSMSMRATPRSRAILTPSPVAKSPLVVGTAARSGANSCSRLLRVWSLPKPPVVRMTLSAVRVASALVASSRYFTPVTVRRVEPSYSSCFVWRSSTATVDVMTLMRSWNSVWIFLARRLMIEYPMGTGVPSGRFGARCVRGREWPPSWAMVVRLSPVSRMTQCTLSADLTERVLTRPVSHVPPSPDLKVSRSKKRPSSEMSRLPCDVVPQPFIPLVALALLPPRRAVFSSSTTLAPQRAASMAAEHPARPPPMTTTRAGNALATRAAFISAVSRAISCITAIRSWSRMKNVKSVAASRA
mmetsp:Transcript_11075/g.34309  ORF Transcript_11075/g.34309 Transcript_11075/m.34309 type:complete len:331 (-) Transcript_11075:1318-2310(-)